MTLADRRAKSRAYRDKVLSLFRPARGPDMCGVCQFFYSDIADPPEGWGRCRKKAPEPKMEVVVNLDRLYPAVWWPETHHQYWCGDFRRRRWWHRRNRP